MKAQSICLFCCLAALPATAQTSLPTIRVSSETVPPGGLAQMKVLITSPKPITSGDMSLDLSAVAFDSIDGIALFSSTGDVGGAAVVDKCQRERALYVSPGNVRNGRRIPAAHGSPDAQPIRRARPELPGRARSGGVAMAGPARLPPRLRIQTG